MKARDTKQRGCMKHNEKELEMQKLRLLITNYIYVIEFGSSMQEKKQRLTELMQEYTNLAKETV